MMLGEFDEFAEYRGEALHNLPQWFRDSARIIRPGTIYTADIKLSRLNIEVDEQGRVTKMYWG